MTEEELQEIADTYGLYTEQDVKNRVSCELLSIGTRNEELEKENAELKERIKTQEQLTKAKEIIKELSKSLFLAKGTGRDLIDDTVDFKESKDRAIYCYEQEKFDIYKQAEQFLKESE